MNIINIPFIEKSNISEASRILSVAMLKNPLLPPLEMDRVCQRHAGEYLSVPWLATILVAFDVIIPLNYARWKLLLKPWVKKSPAASRSFWFWKDVIIEPH